jgi:hypothetical protein
MAQHQYQFDASINPEDFQSSDSLDPLENHQWMFRDSIPRSYPEYSFPNAATLDLSINEGAYLGGNITQLLPTQMDCSDRQSRQYQFSSNHRYDDVHPAAGTDIQEGYSSCTAGDDPFCSRTWPQYYIPKTTESFSLDCAHSPTYLLDPLTDPCPNLEVDFPKKQPCEGRHREFSRLSISRSPTVEIQEFHHASPTAFEYNPDIADNASSRVSEIGDDEIMSGNPSSSEGRNSDEPYAKLIFKALLSAPNHSMVLREIYQWFMDNTEKGSASTSGWRNSIRHNLSMNAVSLSSNLKITTLADLFQAFRKTDRPSSGDDTKKTSEWVLEPFAIKNGVTPTTRYRPKHPKKAVRTGKTGKLLSLRVESGRKGGQATGKTKSNIRRPRDLQHISAQSDFGTHQPPATNGVGGAPSNRHNSPSTPPGIDLPPSNHKYEHRPFNDTMTLSDVKGIYNLNSDPLFYGDEHTAYMDPQLQMWSPNFQY